jgi:hypothetical protein
MVNPDPIESDSVSALLISAGSGEDKAMTNTQFIAGVEAALRKGSPPEHLAYLTEGILPVAADVFDRYIVNRSERESPHFHEIDVLGRTLRIMAVSGPERDSGLPFEPDDFLFGGLVALTHDLGEIRRVTELDIERALARGRDNGDFAEALTLIQSRASERPQHMIKGAEAARAILEGHTA